MLLILTFAIAFGTALAWSWMFLRRDKFDPEPRRLLILLFAAGCLVTIPAAIMEHLIPANEFIGPVVVAPLVEEGLKLTAVALICWSNRHFNQLIDGAIYAISCALGFAAVENLLYGITGGVGLLGLRAILGPIGHPLFTGVSGFYLARAKFEGNAWRLPQGLVLGILLHAGWNVSPALVGETGQRAYAAVILAVIPLYAWLLLRFLRRLATPDAQRLRGALQLGSVSPQSRQWRGDQ
jgi:protease PrsW